VPRRWHLRPDLYARGPEHRCRSHSKCGSSVVAFIALVMSAACGGSTPVRPSTSCGTSGDLIGTGFGGPAVSGFAVDRSTLTGGLGVNLRIGERARVRVMVGRPSISNSCQSSGTIRFTRCTHYGRASSVLGLITCHHGEDCALWGASSVDPECG
jgi:hypothetical protein